MRNRPTAANRIRELRTALNWSQAQLAEACRPPTTQPQIDRLEKGERELTLRWMERVAPALGVVASDLLPNNTRVRQQPFAESMADQNSQRKVAGRNESALAFDRGNTRTEDQYQLLSELVPIIGAVQAGAWMEAYQLQESEWKEMRLPADPRYPGIPRYGLRNVGVSMDKICKDGGTWIFVRFSDLVGRRPKPGDYVIVERHRKDGLVEATCKKLDFGKDGKLCLLPESNDRRFQASILLEGDHEVEEIRVVGLVTEAVNRL